MTKARTQQRRVSNQLRIIGGKWRGRKLTFPDVDGLRPSGDRLREMLFNWVNFELPGSYCLDLFAGSGALGLEALSRGAAHATLVELNDNAARHLKQHCQTLSADNAIVVHNSALKWLDQSANQKFDLVFLDPPFSQPLLEPACELLEQRQWLTENALIYVETPLHQAPKLPDNWQLIKEKHSGQVTCRLYQRSV
ncbi:16S rRNA (guanine(966)-N(2))-methyltransferase RsmD [Porticoccaceae bacterium LTM1]|nr:16S rRNA (guanine(966)-N(2))-methyltransferase RsmD [Porticoccaceae bacterium LTM1]